MRAPFQLDLHVPNFNYPDVAPDALFEKLVEGRFPGARAGALVSTGAAAISGSKKAGLPPGKTFRWTAFISFSSFSSISESYISWI